MTRFARTDSGLTNLALFYSVDLVVFTEGGSRTLTVDEVMSGEENLAPKDSKFWRMILDKNGVAKPYAVKAIGSKTSVLNIAEKIEAGAVQNVAAAMDRDLDDFFRGALQSPLVLYTHAYSWEADVFTKELTKEQISQLLFVESLDPAVEREIDKAYEAFEKAGTKIARIEMIFRSQGISWVSGARGERFFRPDNAAVLDRKNVRQWIDESKGRLQRPVGCPAPLGKRLDPYKVNCGKMLRALSVAVIKYVGRKYGKIKSMQNEVIAAAMLERFGNSASHVKSTYYAAAVGQLNRALT